MNLLYGSDVLRPQSSGKQACPGAGFPITATNTAEGADEPCQTQCRLRSIPPLPVLPPGQVKPGCDFEHLSHRKAISQLLLLTDCAKAPSSENCSELNVISHHYILLQ